MEIHENPKSTYSKKVYESLMLKLKKETGLNFDEEHFNYERGIHEISLLNEFYDKVEDLKNGKSVSIAGPHRENIKINLIKSDKDYLIISSEDDNNNIKRYFYIPTNKEFAARIALADARRVGNQNNLIMPYNVGHCVITESGSGVAIIEIQGGYSSANKERIKLISRALTTKHAMWKIKLLTGIIENAIAHGKKVIIPTGEKYKERINEKSRNLFDTEKHDALIRKIAETLGLTITTTEGLFVLSKPVNIKYKPNIKLT